MIYADIKYSKELKDLFPDAEWWWVKYGDNEWGIRELSSKTREGYLKHPNYFVFSPALTTDMLLERLPKVFKKKYTHDGLIHFYLTIAFRYDDNDKDIWITYYMNNDYADEFTINAPSELYGAEDKSLPNALAKLLLWLIKENLIIKDNK